LLPPRSPKGLPGNSKVRFLIRRQGEYPPSQFKEGGDGPDRKDTPRRAAEQSRWDFAADIQRERVKEKLLPALRSYTMFLRMHGSDLPLKETPSSALDKGAHIYGQLLHSV